MDNGNYIQTPKLPHHACSLVIEHNPHKGTCETVESWVQFRDSKDAFENVAEYNHCVYTDELWEVQWYPETPNGCYLAAASSFGGAIERALQMERENRRATTKE